MKTFVLNGWAAGEDAWKLCAFRRERIFSYVEQLDGLPEKAIAECDEDVLAVGWSMGGSGALRMFLEFPDKVRALVLVAATARMMKDENWPGMSERRLEALRRGLEITRGEGFFGPAEGRPNPYVLDSGENLERGLGYLRETDLRARLATAARREETPARIFQSEKDGIVRAENARHLAGIFPLSETTIVPGCEHALPVAIPDLIDSAVEELAGGTK